MTNTDAHAELDLCPADPGGDGVQVLRPRAVPLGGRHPMTVHRVLPQRERSFVGAWCFVDHYGPDEVSRTGGMDVAPHPHTGLQTVSWLFEGRIEHRDSAGVHALVDPGEVNLMTGGRGIAHSEVSTPETAVLRGVQLWVALPDADRNATRDFQRYRPPLVEVGPGVRARVLVGSLSGQSSPVATFTRLIGAELHLDAGARCLLPVDPGDEHGLLVDKGAARLGGTELAERDLGVVEIGHEQLAIETDRPTRALLLGGAPFGEEIVMWWNFIARSHDEIVDFREEWQRHGSRFGEVAGYSGPTPRLDAPPLPGVRLRPRSRLGREARGSGEPAP